MGLRLRREAIEPDRSQLPMNGHEKSASAGTRLVLGWGNDLVSAVGFWRFDLFGISGLLAHRFIFGCVFKFFDRLAEALGEGRQFGATEEY